MKRLRVLTGYAAHARFNAEIAESDFYAYEIARIPSIPSPYAYSPTHTVSLWRGVPIIIVETKHRRYEVFDVTGIPAVTDPALKSF